ncbi:sister chromatid cohesion 1 protein 2 isoform X2 [Malania oleifera]|uniref:sister chromatid cohesion 1 protein 2 isoform X2 n=1 Tax=Malania oleifera TaxID=397392 RepID=UPI0025AEAD08|nr:sister chromatid cohesion 1 protein 2 isoform X2 [Malania oleifera]
MFYSKCLLSRKGPLGVIWVAAYCHKRLKKSQVVETDISSSIEKILLKDFPEVACRVLGYLLLGVVRIYSKKVEYLFDDCRKVLNRINAFVNTKIVNTHREASHAPFLSITLPARFELDAFDLEVLEDVSGDHVRPLEEITLKEAWRNETVGHYSLDMCVFEEDVAETFSAAHAETSSVAQTPAEYVLSPSTVSRSNNLSSLEVSLEKLRDERFPQEECLDFGLICMVEEECQNLISPFGEGHHIDGGEINCPQLTFSENGESQLIKDQINVLSHHLMENEMVGSPSHNLSKPEASIKTPEDFRFSQEDYLAHEKADEVPTDLVRSKELHADGIQKKSFEETPLEKSSCLVITERAVSATVNTTPESKFSTVSGVTNPEFMVIPTPAKKESSHIPRKRKCSFDDFTVLPNKVLRERIYNPNDLVCKRRPAPHTALDAWKACQISNLAHGFSEPLLPYSSLEIRSLFGEKKLKTSKTTEPAEIGEGLDKLDVLVSPNVGRSTEETALAPGTPVDHSTSAILDVPGSPTVGRSSDQTAIAPETPTDHPASTRLCRGPRSLHRWGSMSSSESVDRESFSAVDEDCCLDLMSEDISSCEGHSCEQDYGELYGWSVRTRAVAGYLRRSFLNRRKQRKEEVVSLLRVLKGRTKEESARVFYEILGISFHQSSSLNSLPYETS